MNLQSLHLRHLTINGFTEEIYLQAYRILLMTYLTSIFQDQM